MIFSSQVHIQKSIVDITGTKKVINEAVYTAKVTPSKQKSESITYGPTDGPTDKRSYIVASERLKTFISRVFEYPLSMRITSLPKASNGQ